ncbi:hypothetical protein VSU01S_18500 [Vibrio superstes NBRC 103154]|uniref:Putative Flp pilus-assembly TadG-like N-terminal domain-containing protein n=1 Tax=Vibrio superstes NBRC 103154 TaxID=1219062 RepID=A0A511QQG9_9VIBR|nr:hypothetical protein VSU01S_18500 [Vibrio superstes NBRC 103154]
MLIGFAALAIDINHMILNKSRVQNGVDSAALSASVAIDNGATINQASAAAMETIKEMASANGNNELNFGVSASSSNTSSNREHVYTFADGTNIKIQFSNDPTSFNASEPFQTTRDIYTRVAVSGHNLDSYLIQAFGISKSVNASAVSGRSSGIENTGNIAPIGLCGDSGGTPGGDFWGYNFGQEYQLSGKTSDNSNCNGNNCDDSTDGSGDVGPGNYNYLDLGAYSDESDKGGGASDLEKALAGAPLDDTELGGIKDYAVGDFVLPKTGVSEGKAKSGINSRFEASKNSSFPAPDDDVTSDNLTDYQSTLNNVGNGRRLVVMPIINCDPSTSGSSSSMEILAFACIFLSQKYDKQTLYGKFYDGCSLSNGGVGNDPTATGPYKIQLYRDPYAGDS